MVHNPKNSQKAMIWCLDTALELVFKAISGLKNKTSQKELRDYICENTLNISVTRQQIKQTIYDLKRRKYIDFGGGDSVILTNKAKIKIIDRIISPDQIDGKYRFVSFDIPESMRASRDSFRRTLKRMGFCQIQKSLWVTDRNVGDFVEMAAIEHNVSDYVAYFVADKSNIDKHISEVLSKNQNKFQ